MSNTPSEIIYLDRVDSTNSYLLRNPELLRVPWTTIVAREQTGGRGRKERTWHSAPEKDLTFSLVYHPPGKVRQIRLVTLVVGLAVQRALGRLSGITASLKWPNDIRIKGKKVCGILTELHLGEGGAAVIIGVGLNVNSQAHPAPAVSGATSLLLESGEEHDLASLLQRIRNEMIDLLSRFSSGQRKDMLRRWREASDSIGKKIRTVLSGRVLEGIFRDLTEDGEVILLDARGKTHVCTGEIEYLS